MREREREREEMRGRREKGKRDLPQLAKKFDKALHTWVKFVNL